MKKRLAIHVSLILEMVFLANKETVKLKLIRILKKQAVYLMNLAVSRSLASRQKSQAKMIKTKAEVAGCLIRRG